MGDKLRAVSGREGCARTCNRGTGARTRSRRAEVGTRNRGPIERE